MLPAKSLKTGRRIIVAIFYPFSQFCEIDISLLSLQTQPNTAPNLFQRGVEYGKFEDIFFLVIRWGERSARTASPQPSEDGEGYRKLSLSLSLSLPLSLSSSLPPSSSLSRSLSLSLPLPLSPRENAVPDKTAKNKVLLLVRKHLILSKWGN